MPSFPGHSTPEQYTKEITIANDGICRPGRRLQVCPELLFGIIEELDQFGIRFQKDENGEYDVKKVHHIGNLCPADAEWRHGQEGALPPAAPGARVLISNRYMATRLLTGKSGRAAGAIAVNTRTGEFLVIKAKAVIMCMGAAGRLGLPTSGYLYRHL